MTGATSRRAFLAALAAVLTGLPATAAARAHSRGFGREPFGTWLFGR